MAQGLKAKAKAAYGKKTTRPTTGSTTTSAY